MQQRAGNHRLSSIGPLRHDQWNSRLRKRAIAGVLKGAGRVSCDETQGSQIRDTVAPLAGTTAAAHTTRSRPVEVVHMIEGHDIICFSNDWDSDPLSKKHIMQRFAKRNRILWVNSVGIRRPEASVSDLRRVI